MASFNRIIMVGNLTKDPDLKQVGAGQPVCRLSVASNRQYKNRQTGSLVQEVCYVDVDVWGPQADSCSQYLAKGRPVLIEGRLKFDSWKDAEGQTRSKHSIVADRVVFLAANQAAEVGLGDELRDEMSSDEAFAPAQPAKKAKAPTRSKAVDGMDSLSSDGMNFKDEAPFADDLPF